MGKKRDYREWSKSDVKELRRLFPKTATKKVATVLRRSVPSITQKALRLGLTKTKKFLREHLGRK